MACCHSGWLIGRAAPEAGRLLATVDPPTSSPTTLMKETALRTPALRRRDAALRSIDRTLTLRPFRAAVTIER